MVSERIQKPEAETWATGLRDESQRAINESGKGVLLDLSPGAVEKMLDDADTFLEMGREAGDGARYRLWAHREDGRVWVYALFGHSDSRDVWRTVCLRAIADLTAEYGDIIVHFRKYDTPLMNYITRSMPVAWGSYNERGRFLPDAAGTVGRILLSDAREAIQ